VTAFETLVFKSFTITYDLKSIHSIVNQILKFQTFIFVPILGLESYFETQLSNLRNSKIINN
jgi:hypothetical protein